MSDIDAIRERNQRGQGSFRQRQDIEYLLDGVDRLSAEIIKLKEAAECIYGESEYTCGVALKIEIEKLRADNAALIKGLKHYAQRGNWSSFPGCYDGMEYQGRGEDGFKRHGYVYAREVLDTIGGWQ